MTHTTAVWLGLSASLAFLAIRDWNDYRRDHSPDDLLAGIGALMLAAMFGLFVIGSPAVPSSVLGITGAILMIVGHVVSMAGAGESGNDATPTRKSGSRARPERRTGVRGPSLAAGAALTGSIFLVLAFVTLIGGVRDAGGWLLVLGATAWLVAMTAGAWWIWRRRKNVKS